MNRPYSELEKIFPPPGMRDFPAFFVNNHILAIFSSTQISHNNNKYHVRMKVKIELDEIKR